VTSVNTKSRRPSPCLVRLASPPPLAGTGAFESPHSDGISSQSASASPPNLSQAPRAEATPRPSALTLDPLLGYALLTMAESAPTPSTPPDWPTEFASVITCTRCTTVDSSKLLRDNGEHIPQPGYIGARYASTRVLLVGQNPGVNTVGLAAPDRVYTAALRTLGRTPNDSTFKALCNVMDAFVPSWPVHGRYFPLAECGLTLQDIAYCNAVRCRTVSNTTPSNRLATNCVTAHFQHWLILLEPCVVVFIGKWAHDQCRAITESMGIPSAYMNRQRSLSGAERIQNREEVVRVVRSTRSSR